MPKAALIAAVPQCWHLEAMSVAMETQPPLEANVPSSASTARNDGGLFKRPHYVDAVIDFTGGTAGMERKYFDFFILI